ncbi:MAG: redox-regulated ATPase YchF [Clostridiaceae bacterium]
MKLGIVGLPNVGKSTLFNAITQAGAESANYPFCTIEPNIGVVSVPDERLDHLVDMYKSKKKVETAIEFYDIAGLVKGASKGEGLGNKFLSHIREVEAIVHVVRAFEDPNVVHVDGNVDPIRDIETINLELILADMEVLEKRMDKAQRQVRSGDKQAKIEYELMERIKVQLEDEKPARTLEFTPEEEDMVHQFFLITSKKILYVANISEEELQKGILENDMVKQIKDYAKQEEAGVIVICAKLEEDMAGLSNEEKHEMLLEYGLKVTGLDLLVQESYSLLGLMSFLTAGPMECRAWTIIKGTKAPQAAGKIHSDIERGFIRAEIVSYDDLMKLGSESAAKEKGLYRLEGKDYIMKDGDVVNFRFNV